MDCNNFQNFQWKRDLEKKEPLINKIQDEYSRKYEISEKAKNDWKQLGILEKGRYSFFDELMKRGYILDSMEVPARSNDVTNLIEADIGKCNNSVEYGRMVFKSKQVFTGNLRYWHFSGPGRYTWLDGTIYQGDFKDGLMHGEGILLLPDGCFYEGEFENGERSGWGIYTTSNGLVYAGDWLKGLPHGLGKVWFNPNASDADFYDGEWVNGIIHGRGTRQYKNGDRFVGTFNNGIRKGQGMMMWLDERQVYKGEWLDGQPNGFGEHIWYLPRGATSPYPERNVYKGEFANGLRHGVGRMIYACGSMYDGKWHHGVRHGKGIYVNPAGEILFGIFHYGSIAGGADVPLHVPTYSCKYHSLVKVLQQRLHTTESKEAHLEEDYLTETVTRFLFHIRSLYRRAGYLGEWWGNQGHYPEWLKNQKHSPKHHLHKRQMKDISILQSIQHQIYGLNEGEEAEDDESWLHGHKPHYGSPDHVNPVTRFGLWLLLKDCPGVITDLTLEELDNVWTTIPSISFQTRHHPFEPVHLWQFVQCLIVVSTLLYIEIPKRKQPFSAQDEEYEEEFIAEEDQPVNEENRKSTEEKDLPIIQVLARKHSSLNEDEGARRSPDEPELNLLQIPEKEARRSTKQSQASESSSLPKKQSIASNAAKHSSKSKLKWKKSMGKGKLKNGKGTSHESVVDQTLTPVLSETSPISQLAHSETQTEGIRYGIEKTDTEMQTEAASPEEDIRDFMISEAFELFLTDFLIPCLEQRPGKNLPHPPNPMPSSSDLYAAFNIVAPYKDVISAREFLIGALQHTQIPDDESIIYWKRSHNLITPDIKLEKLINEFADRKISDREALVQVQPASSTGKGRSLESVEIPDYELLSTTIISNPDILSDELKNEIFAPETMSTNHNRKSSVKVFGTGNFVFGPEFDDPNGQIQDGTFSDDPFKGIHLSTEDFGLGPGVSMMKVESFTDFDKLPLAEQDLTRAPFFWSTEPTCIINQSKNSKIFDNLEISDVLSIFKKFYPKACDGSSSMINLEFNLTFGDWVWLTTIVTKLSTDRSFFRKKSAEPVVEEKQVTIEETFNRRNDSIESSNKEEEDESIQKTSLMVQDNA